MKANSAGLKPVLAMLALAAVVLAGTAPAQSNLPAAAASAIPTNAVVSAKRTYIVTLRAEADQDQCASDHQIERARVFRHALNGFVADLDDAAVERLKRDGRVRTVEKDGPVAFCSEDAAAQTPIQNGPVRASGTNGPTGPSLLNFPQQIPAGIARMDIPDFPVAHINYQVDPINVDVAVLDSGIDNAHPDLNVVQMAGFADPGYNGLDWNGHGTWVAGILGAIDNTIGVVGVAPNVRLWSVQVIGPTQSAWANIIAGIDYIAQHADQISVVNASLGPAPGSDDLPYTAVHEAVSNLVSMGVVFVAAAGNNNGQDIAGVDGVWGINPATGKCDDFIPAALPEVMAVSAMDPVKNVIASFSNCCRINKVPSYVTSRGLGIDVAAPGVNIYSTWLTSTNGYTFQSGTSGASPHVAGLVALYIAANGRATNAAGVYRIRQAIIDAGQPQSQWGVTNTMDPDGNPEPLAYASNNLVPQPNILSVAHAAGACQVSFATVPGYIYTAQYSGSLSATNQWINLGNPYTNILGSLLTATLTDTNPSPAARFYRLVRDIAP